MTENDGIVKIILILEKEDIRLEKKEMKLREKIAELQKKLKELRGDNIPLPIDQNY